MPPHWHLVDIAFARQFGCAHDVGFVGTKQTVRRFAARYRLARSFECLKFKAGHDYGEETATGYERIFRVFLCWSAFELLTKITGTRRDPAAIEAFAISVGSEAAASAIYGVPDHTAYLDAVLEKVTTRGLKLALQDFMARVPNRVMAVPESIRHIFAHGELTPNAGRAVEACSNICEISTDLMFRIMDKMVEDRFRRMRLIT